MIGVRTTARKEKVGRRIGGPLTTSRQMASTPPQRVASAVAAATAVVAPAASGVGRMSKARLARTTSRTSGAHRTAGPALVGSPLGDRWRTSATTAAARSRLAALAAAASRVVARTGQVDGKTTRTTLAWRTRRICCARRMASQAQVGRRVGARSSSIRTRATRRWALAALVGAVASTTRAVGSTPPEPTARRTRSTSGAPYRARRAPAGRTLGAPSRRSPRTA
mmetsp:Transcript_73590/g.213158  ORF Transcript_73590/g.213158 Transcript_73590/m.213158 type:complete len:224 (-) Transcript_73590:2156-2827(-)